MFSKYVILSAIISNIICDTSSESLIYKKWISLESDSCTVLLMQSIFDSLKVDNPLLRVHSYDLMLEL